MPDSDEANSFCALVRLGVRISAPETCFRQFKKKRFYVFFILVTFFTFFNVFFYFRNVFLFLKMLAKFRAASRLTRSTFKITATKQTYHFLLHVE